MLVKPSTSNIEPIKLLPCSKFSYLVDSVDKRAFLAYSVIRSVNHRVLHLISIPLVFTELRQSRQSLAVSERMSRVSYPGTHTHTHTHARPRQRPRSSSRDHSAPTRPHSRYSTTGSLTYGDVADNWTDHDMDIYMARNPTTRGGLVPL